MVDGLEEAIALKVEAPDRSTLLAGQPFAFTYEVAGVAKWALREEDLGEAIFERLGQCRVVYFLGIPYLVEFVLIHAAVGVPVADALLGRIEAGEELAEGAGAGLADCRVKGLNSLVDLALLLLSSSFAFGSRLFALRFAITLETATLAKVVECATEFIRLERMIQRTCSEQVWELMDGGHGGISGANLGIELVDLPLDEESERVAGRGSQGGKQASLSQLGIQRPRALPPATDLPADQTLGAAVCPPGFIAPTLDISFHASLKNPDSGADNPLPAVAILFKQSPPNGAGTEIQPENKCHFNSPICENYS